MLYLQASGWVALATLSSWTQSYVKCEISNWNSRSANGSYMLCISGLGNFFFAPSCDPGCLRDCKRPVPTQASSLELSSELLLKSWMKSIRLPCDEVKNISLLFSRENVKGRHVPCHFKCALIYLWWISIFPLTGVAIVSMLGFKIHKLAGSFTLN